MIYVNLFFCGGIMDVRNISQAVITRLPRYYRFLGELKDKGVERISSQELADIMNALMAIPNLVSLLLLSGVIARETKKYLWEGSLDEVMENQYEP